MRPLLALLLLVTATVAVAQQARVIDGDTIELSTGERIRLWGIDAPEGDQICQRDGRPWRCGDEAAAALRTLIDHHQVTCATVDRDRYDHTVAVCLANSRDIGAELIRQGWALGFDGRSTGTYAGEQLEAEQAGRGLWSGSFVPPWEWRERWPRRE
jgi:endonuclease YncB( thermonuclease family)